MLPAWPPGSETSRRSPQAVGRGRFERAVKLIVTHEQPDFDALAGLALAALAHPGAVAVIGGDMPDNVRAFIHLYRDQLPVRSGDEIDPSEVTELIVVDTNDAQRLGRFGALADTVPVTLYDHHPRDESEITAAHGIQELVGATATLLTRHLDASSIEIPAELASLALLAIHEDTGNLSFDLTTADDYRAAACLMESGASLEVVREFQSDYADQEQSALLQSAIGRARTVPLEGFNVAVSAFEYPVYVRNAAGVCNRLLSHLHADAALLSVRMEGKTLLFARSLRGFDVGAALAESAGGGGHRGAAFARSEEGSDEAAERALEALGRHVQPALQARDIMSSPVKTVTTNTPVHEVQRLLSQFGHNGVPVLAKDGSLEGVVSRRDLDRALRHDLSRSKVSGFMTRDVIRAAPDTTLMTLERLVEEHNIGRIPIVDETGKVVGIVTRSDLLAAHHPPREPATALKVRERLPSEARRVIERASAHLAGTPAAALYLVGGTVRDALLGRALVDLDLVVERFAAEALVGRLQRELGGSMTFHAAFGTSTLSLPSGLTVDIAAAREEYYEHPGALPEVVPSSIRKDLGRRDFTINAMAVRLSPGPPAMTDPFDGASDLERRTLRPLHPLSFIEDPTRILRGARLAARLGFTMAESAKAQATAALKPEVLTRLSSSRTRAELELTFGERRVAPALRVLDSLGAMDAVYGLPGETALADRLDSLRAAGEVPDLSYLLALLLVASAERAESHVEAFHWPRRLLALRERLAEAQATDYVAEEWLEEADDAERTVLRVLSPALEGCVRAFEEVPRRRKVRGRDVLELGLPAGPGVGEVLAEIARARQHGRVKSFEDELELARRRVEEHLGRRARE
jgi:tRNA nucleotidyltransferase (CCA-adding enzyme)